MDEIRRKSSAENGPTLEMAAELPHIEPGSSASSNTSSTIRDETNPSASPTPPNKKSPAPSESPSSATDEKGHARSALTASELEAQDAEANAYSQKRFGFIRYTALNVYRRLFSLAFMGNAIAFVILMARGTTPLDLVNASAVNLAVCGLCRQPLVVNALFLVFGSVPRSAPMRIRRLACKIFHLGGLHSGAGVASFVWYIGFAGLYTHNFVPSPISIAVLVLVWAVLALLVSIIVVAFPRFRSKRHDYFELTHRFSNWLILAIFWAIILLLGSQEPPLARFLLHLPAFWTTIILTLATVHPWLLLRRVPVVPEPLSPHAVRLHFSHRPIQFGQALTLARHPLADWHSFATFPDTHDTPATQFSCLVSRAGDWTRAVIAAPPTHLWTRGVPTYVFSYVFRMFPRIVVVTTGSGIGPCLSFLADARRPAMRVVWQTKAPVRTYGQRTLDLVRRMDRRPVVVDTSVSGRVEMLPIVLRLCREFDAHAVCVVSNPQMTRRLVYALETRGIVAYGPIFDS